MTKEEFINKLINDVSADTEIKARLLRNPKSYIEQKLNIKLPDDFEVEVHEDTPNRLNIVLPVNSEELSDIELVAVSGAGCYTDNSCTTFREW